MIPARRILLLAPDREHLEELPARLAGDPDPIVARVTRRMREALFALAHERFDAAVCWLESPCDVARVVRFKGAAPRTPILAVTRGGDAELASLSLRMGASAVLSEKEDPARTIEALKRTLETRGLTRALAAATEEVLHLSCEVRELAHRCQTLLSQAVQLVSRNRADGFEPLLVEDDPNDALFFSRALRKMGLPRRVSVVRSADEAIDYLAGRETFSDRSRHPVPTLIVLDYHLGSETGEKVLRWIRSEPDYARLPVVLFSGCANPDDLARMRLLGLNAHVEKPLFAEEMEQTAGLILEFWQMWRLAGGEPG